MLQRGGVTYIPGSEPLHVVKQEEPSTIAFYYKKRLYVYQLSSIGSYFVYKAEGHLLTIRGPNEIEIAITPSSDKDFKNQ